MKVKLIWKFYGQDSLKTANHHLIHLKDFAEEKNIILFGNGVETNKLNLSEAYIIVLKENVDSLREILKPHKGVLLNNQ
ncbi:MAG: hypothetical protein CMD02_05265 [Flavobacteriales bacterium]|nr:hypothetical protein [Flavobacteriales bacterium]|tara:strand:- start:2155 stop:2391 length:237 start_codon:yes stop_codon:yes gene_type:complete